MNPHVLAGSSRGELTLLRGGAEIATQRVALRTVQRSTTTAVAVGVVMPALFGIAYPESNFRGLRRGRGGVSPPLGLRAGAAATPVAGAGAAWVLLGTVPTVPALGAHRTGKRYRREVIGDGYRHSYERESSCAPRVEASARSRPGRGLDSVRLRLAGSPARASTVTV